MKSLLLPITLLSLLIVLFIPNQSQSATEQRTALVIGNGSYAAGPLKNPVTDATDMAATLKRLGFKVILKTNARFRDMDSAIREFGRKLSRSEVGLFYFAGHGIQVGGVNYLIPVGANIEKEEDVRYESIDAGRVLAEMAHANNGLNIVILDACRNNPFARSFRSETRGLAIISHVPKGAFISFATSPGDVARDGEGRNSPYTKSLIKYMKQPGLPIETVFKKVRQTLDDETGGKQIPWESSSLKGDFYFVPDVSGRKGAVTRDDGAEATSAKLDVLENENRKLETERLRLEQEKAALAKQKGLDEKRRQIEEEKERLEAEKEAQRQAAAERKKAKKTAKTAPKKKTTDVAMAKYPSEKPLALETFTSPTIGAKFVLIPEGTFIMGGKGPPHQVTISKPFYMQTTELTQGQWKAIMGSNPSYFKKCGDDCPVEKVSWNDVQDFIRRLNQQERTDKYRLPTEAEWEYAARAGTTTPFHTGNCLSTDQANYDGNYPYSDCPKGEKRDKTIPVASFAPNAWGLYDMHGNVWEWVQDWNEKGHPSGETVIVRGGSWFGYASYCNSAFHFYYAQHHRTWDVGFRLTRTE